MLSTQIRIKNFFPNTRYKPVIKLESKIIRVVLYIYMLAFQIVQHRRKKAAEFSIAAFYIAAARAPQKN